MQITLALCEVGPDPANTAGRPLTEDERKYLAAHRVGRLAVTRFSVRGREVVMTDRYPGFWPVFSFVWDGYHWNYHSVEEAVPFQDAERASLLCRGRAFCADYGRFETWMRYEYEMALYADGRGCEILTLIPDPAGGLRRRSDVVGRGVAEGGSVGAYDPAGVFLALLVPRGTAEYAGEIRQFDASGYPGDELQLALLPSLLDNWPAGRQ